MISEAHKKLDESASDVDVHVKKATTPLPKGKIAVICWIMFADFYGVLLILPFLPFMVSDFFPELDRTEIGKKAGFLGSAYYIGCLGGSFMWGWLADITGRRPALLCCICCIIVNFTLFGFSQNFAWAVCTRLLWGLLDGILGLSKTYISEICDETNQGKGFAMIATMGGFGRIFGSLTGGFLARPASKYPLLNIPFFCNFPYVLPCLVGVSANIISLIMAWLFLPETLKKAKIKKLNSPTVTTNDGDVNSVTITSDDDLEEGGEKQPLLRLHKYRKTSVNKLKLLLKKAWRKLAIMANLMKDRRVLLTSALYGLLAFTVIIVDLVFPLLMVTDHRHGGYDMDDNEIGIFLSISSLASVLYQLEIPKCGLGWFLLRQSSHAYVSLQVFGYSPVAKLLGYRNSFRLGSVVFAIGCILMPLANHISGPIGDSQSDNGNSTHGLNATVWNYTADNNMVAMVDYNENNFNHLWTFSTLYGSKYQSQSGSVLNSMEYYGNTSLDNNLTNNSCHSSRLGSTVGKNSVKRIPARVWLTVSWILAMMTIGRLTGFTSVSVMIGNSVLSVTRGTVYGIGQSLGSLGRSTGPLIGTPLFAWSERNGHGWPLNYHFIYDVVAVMVVIFILISFALPKSTEKKRLPDPVKPQATNIHYPTKNK